MAARLPLSNAASTLRLGGEGARVDSRSELMEQMVERHLAALKVASDPLPVLCPALPPGALYLPPREADQRSQDPRGYLALDRPDLQSPDR